MTFKKGDRVVCKTKAYMSVPYGTILVVNKVIPPAYYSGETLLSFKGVGNVFKASNFGPEVATEEVVEKSVLETYIVYDEGNYESVGDVFEAAGEDAALKYIQEDETYSDYIEYTNDPQLKLFQLVRHIMVETRPKFSFE
jgi:hypothetical protein